MKTRSVERVLNSTGHPMHNIEQKQYQEQLPHTIFYRSLHFQHFAQPRCHSKLSEHLIIFFVRSSWLLCLSTLCHDVWVDQTSSLLCSSLGVLYWVFFIFAFLLNFLPFSLMELFYPFLKAQTQVSVILDCF